MNEQVDELVDAIDEMRSEGCEKFSIKQAELKKKSLLERLDSLQNENTVTIEPGYEFNVYVTNNITF